MTAGAVFSGPQWQRFATTDSDQAHAFIRRSLIDVNVRFAGEGPGGAGLRTVFTQLDDVRVNRLHYSARTRLDTSPAGDLIVTHLMSGYYVAAHGKDEYLLRPGDVVLILPDQPLEVDFGDVDALNVRLPRKLLEEVADAQTGISGADLRFDTPRPISAALGRHWVHTVAYLTRTVLSDPALMSNPLIAGQARQLLASTALAVFPNTGHDVRPRHPGEVSSQVLRRAMAFVEENIDRSLTVAEMAAAAGVRPRALQLAFRRHRDTTPTQYARTVRMERAHRDLQASDPTTGVTVAMIANRWGFTHLGRFSTDYRAAYGTSPSRTLRT
ncbi:AraC family transcriptional regulator [Amorphoplanes digitatis]|uniref:AraC-like DNA-binding protein n=1 Tax=Actinoplanes digitatis TaxID=1868 RepID=A0A7W7HTU8_9ACTN|nr:AraC family transcriptional regulator [Actinoplanes digitatis]MBB4760704.1 AraC-like DNA-binding protein [Actinoplanes digitatis]GID94274.1 AraC family transcriptional regulator [Actinoplanes digitatis]